MSRRVLPPSSPRHSTGPAAVQAVHEISIPTIWRGLLLLLVGAATLVAFIAGDQPTRGEREITAILLFALTLCALFATLRRPSAVRELAALDGLLLVALAVSAAAALSAPIRSSPVLALQWQMGLLGAFMAGRLIGPAIAQPALLLWVLVTGCLWSLHVNARSLDPASDLARAAAAISDVVLLEWTLAIGLLVACVMRKGWARLMPGAGWRSVRRLMLWALILFASALHFDHLASDSFQGFVHQRALGWNMGRALFWEHPMWGWGGGTWDWAVASLAHPPVTDEAFTLGAAEWVGVAGGGMGLMIAALLFIGLLVTLLTAKRESQPSRMGVPLMAAGAICLAWGVMGAWSLAPVRPCNLIILAFMLGTALSFDLRDVAAEELEEERGALWPWARRVVWALAIGLGLTTLASVGLGPGLRAWAAASESPAQACDRARVAARLMPWDDHWPAMEANNAYLWMALSPSGRPANGELLARMDSAFARARQLNPHRGGHFTAPASALRGAGQTDRAEALLTLGLTRLPLDAEIRLMLAMLLEARGEWAQALDVIRPLDQLHPHGHIKVTEARLALAMGDREQAERHAREAIQLGNRSPALRSLLEGLESPLLDLLP